MALIFPFDDTLNGHKEVVTMKSADLAFPIFTFPKGSFFVDQTYAVIKGTRKLLRPGIDYKVLSCNQDIPFSTNTTLNNKLKNNYVRNAVLLTLDSPKELEWHVAYAGGEEPTKPAEYQNFLNMMFNKAQTSATVNYLTTKHQGWGVFVSHDNTQIMQGRYIYSEPLRQEEGLFEGGYNGLGWGKVELALHSMADVVSSGNDPLILEAFYKWIEHNANEFNKYKDQVESDIKSKITALDNKRVDAEQFIYSDSGKSPASQRFIKHNHLILRGIDPNSTQAQTTNPREVLRKGIGFYSLADVGNDINNVATNLLQRKANTFSDTRQTITMEFEQEEHRQDGKSMWINLTAKGGSPNASKKYKFYAVAKNLNKIILELNVTNTIINNSTVRISVIYPTNPVDFSTDQVYCYILDENLEYVNSVNLSTIVTMTNILSSYELLVNNHGSLVSNNDADNTAMDGLTGDIEVIVRRGYAVSAEILSLGLFWEDTTKAVPFNGTTNNVVSFAVGEYEKRVYVRHVYGTPLGSYLQLRLSQHNTIIAVMNVGTIDATIQTAAYVSFHNKIDGKQHAWLQDVLAPSYLLVRFSKNSNFHDSEITLNTGVLTGGNVTVKALEKIVVDETTVAVPLVITGTPGSIFGLSVNNSKGTLISNRINLAISNTTHVSAGTPIIKAVTRGKNLTQYHNGTEWVVVFDLELNGTFADGIIADIGTASNALALPKHAMTRNNRLIFTVRSNRFITEAFTFPVIFNGTSATVSVSASNQTIPLALDDLIYSDGSVAEQTLTIGREFKINVTNPYNDRTITLTLDSFPSSLGINDIKYGGGLTTNTAFKASVVLGPNETKQITNGNYITVTALNSTYPSKPDAELGVVGLFFPPYKVSSVLTAGGVVAATDYETIGKYRVLENVNVRAVNRVTGLATIDPASELNIIDATVSGFTTTAIASATVTSSNPAYSGTIQSLTYSSLTDQNTVSVAFKAIRSWTTELVDDNVSFYVNLLDSSGAVLHILECPMRVVNDV